LERNSSAKKKILVDRFTFLFEVIIVFVGIFLFLLIPRFIYLIITEENAIFLAPLYYVLRAGLVFLAIPLLLYLTDFVLESQKKEIIVEEDISPAMNQLKQYKITKNNFKYQLLYGVMLLFLFFIPLDFFSYLLIPNFLEFQRDGLTASQNPINSYFFQAYFVFLISVIIIQLSVSFYEETVTRGYLAKNGSENFHKISAVMIAAIYFGFGHIGYYDPNYSIVFPMIFFIQAFIVSVVLALFLLKKKWIFPLIFAHGLNNIISAHAIWNSIQGNDFMTVTLYLYIPLLIGSVIIFIWQFPRIKAGLSTGIKDFKTYFKIDDKIGEEPNDKYLRILIDISIGILIFLVAILLTV